MTAWKHYIHVKWQRKLGALNNQRHPNAKHELCMYKQAEHVWAGSKQTARRLVFESQ